jgi:hypothetical protein
VSSNDKIRQNMTCASIALFPAPFRIGLKGSSRQSPSLLRQLPIQSFSGLFINGADERFAPARGGELFSEHGGGRDKISSMKRRIQSVLRG